MDFILEKRETKASRKILNTIIAFFIILIWVNTMDGFLNYLDTCQITIYKEPSLYKTFFLTCIIAPFWEEFVFRVAPITIARNIGKEYIIPTILISSFIFGFLHPQSAHPILFQGVMGFVFSLLYIKNNYNYWSVFVLHFMWNFYILLFYFIL
jgi:membrane protease YdiL (CAAX protease family)